MRTLHIGVGLAGEGSGHAMRMTALCRALTRRHRITFWCPLHVRELLQRSLPQSTYFRLPYLKAVYRNNAIDNVATVRHNLGLFLSSSSIAALLSRRLRRLRVDAVISDYEPLIVRAARSAGIPVLHLNHQHVIDNHPALRTSWFKAMAVQVIVMRNARPCITSSFYNGDVGPLLRPEITALTPTRGDFVFVYAREAFREHIVPALGAFPQTKFLVFPSAEHHYANSLAACRGVIAPAGHQLTSEALHLKKPLLVFPQKGQYEQQLNARMLERSGWGIIGELPTMTESIETFLGSIDRFPLHEPDPRVRYCLHDDTDRAVALVEERLEQLVGGGRTVPRRRTALVSYS
jgi:uncharacterized protein (TIGR00661 family)